MDPTTTNLNDLDRELMHMQHSVTRHSSIHSVFLLLLILGVVLYVAYQLKAFPARWLQMIGVGSVKNDQRRDRISSSTTSPTGSDQVVLKPVTGSVVFDGGTADIGKVSCNNYGSGCKIKVDACKLIGDSLDGSPTCHNVKSLCGKRAGDGVLPWIDNKTFCSMQEAGANGESDRNVYLSGITIPEGITLDVNKSTACDSRSEFSKQCDTAAGCTWTQARYQNDHGLQFGVSPGYQLKCDTRVIKGPPKNTTTS